MYECMYAGNLYMYAMYVFAQGMQCMYHVLCIVNEIHVMHVCMYACMYVM